MRIKEVSADGRRVKGSDGEMAANPTQKTAEKPPGGFLEQVRQVEKQQWRERLDGLLKRIDEQAAKIEQRQNLQDLQRYKELVREFMREASNRTYQRQEEGRWDRRGQYRIMAVVKQVDLQLEELTRQMVDGQQDNLATLKKLGEIRGLLVDLYL